MLHYFEDCSLSHASLMLLESILESLLLKICHPLGSDGGYDCTWWGVKEVAVKLVIVVDGNFPTVDHNNHHYKVSGFS